MSSAHPTHELGPSHLTHEQVGVVLFGAVAMGAAFGLMFGSMDVEDAVEKLRTEVRLSPLAVTLALALSPGPDLARPGRWTSPSSVDGRA